MNRFVPDDWVLTDKLREYARNKRLTDLTIEDQEEAFRLHPFKINVEGEERDWDRTWMRWIRSAIEWGKVQPTIERVYTSTMATDVDSAEEQRKFDEQIARFKK